MPQRLKLAPFFGFSFLFSVPVGVEPVNHLLLELKRSLVQTVNGIAKFKQITNRTQVTCWKIDIKIEVQEKKSLDNDISLINSPALNGSRYKQDAIVTTGKNSTVILVEKIVTHKHLTVTAKTGTRLGCVVLLAP